MPSYCSTFMYRIPEHLVDTIRENRILEEDLIEKDYEDKFKKFGDKYYETFRTIDNIIPTPNNKQVYEKEPDTSLCYLCRTMLAPCLSGEFYGMTAYKNSGDTTFRDGWDSIHSKMYKPHYACFDCRKVWKPLQRSEAETVYFKKLVISNPANTRCSSCRKPGIYMGLNFRAPKKDDIKEWNKVQKILNENPTAFEAKCKCF